MLCKHNKVIGSPEWNHIWIDCEVGVNTASVPHPMQGRNFYSMSICLVTGLYHEAMSYS